MAFLDFAMGLEGVGIILHSYALFKHRIEPVDFGAAKGVLPARLVGEMDGAVKIHPISSDK